MPVTSLDLIRVQGHYLLLNGSPAVGTVTFQSTVVLVNTTANEVVLPSLYTVNLNALGKFSIDLPATDDPDLSPVGWTYLVTETIAGATNQRTPFNIQIPFNTPVDPVTGLRTIDMADVQPAVPVDAVTSYVLLTAYNADQAARKAMVPFNVKDAPYNAVGDGVAYDTAAIQAALDAARTAYLATGYRQSVVVPAGKYRLAFGLAAGKPAGYAINFNACLRLREGVDVLGPGELHPDPVPNTTLTAPLTAGDTTMAVVSTAGFGDEPGFGKQLQFSTTVTIGSWTAATATSFTGVTYTGPTLSVGAIVLQRPSRAVLVTDFTNEITDWAIRGLKIVGGNTQAVESSHEAIVVGPSKRWTIADCEITAMAGKAIHVIGETTGSTRIPSDWTVERNRIHSIAGNAVGYSQAGAKDFKILDNTFSDNLLGGAEAIISQLQQNIDRGVIRGNLVRDYGDIGGGGRSMLIEGNTIVLPATALGPGIVIGNGSNIRIVGNTIDTSAGSSGNNSGIKATDGTTTRLVVTGNTIVTASGIVAMSLGVAASTGLVVSANTCTGQILVVAGSRAAVIGNVAGGLDIRSTTTVVVGNRATRTATIRGADTLVTANQVDTTVGNALEVEAARCIIANNHVLTSAAGAHAIFGGVGSTVDGGVISDNTLTAGTSGTALNMNGPASKVGLVARTNKLLSGSIAGVLEQNVGTSPAVYPTSSSALGILIQGLAGQTQDLVKVTDAAGTSTSLVIGPPQSANAVHGGAMGTRVSRLYLGPSSGGNVVGNVFKAVSDYFGGIVGIVTAIVGQTADLWQYHNSSNVVRSGVNAGGTFYSDVATGGIVLKSPDGKYWRGTIDNLGAVTWADLGTTRPTS